MKFDITLEIFVFVGGFALGLIFGEVFANGTLSLARDSYARCISDGGTKDHCVSRYLIGEKQ